MTERTISKKTKSAPAAAPENKASKSAAASKVTAEKTPAAAKKSAAKPKRSDKVVSPAKAEPATKVAASEKPGANSAKKAATAAKPGTLTEDMIRAMGEEDYMNDAQLAFFRERLLQMRQEVLARELDVKERLHQREVFADPADRATAEEEHWLDLRLRERESLLLRKIDEALKRIADREYGYCEKTGDPIGIPRLLARPTATVCVDVKGQDERLEAQYRDR